MNTLAIVQARTGSSRLPNKVMKTIEGKTIIEILLKRLKKSQEINKIILATSNKKRDDILANHVVQLGFDIFRGKENDVLDRFFSASNKYSSENIIRITGDCPLIDFSIIDEMVKVFKSSDLDYLSNIDPPTFPDGLDVEIFTKTSFMKVKALARSSFDKEHVTPLYRNSKNFKTSCFQNKKDLSGLRFTLDEERDFIFLESVFKHFSPNIYFHWDEVVKIMNSNVNIIKSNQEILRNEGSKEK